MLLMIRTAELRRLMARLAMLGALILNVTLTWAAQAADPPGAAAASAVPPQGLVAASAPSPEAAAATAASYVAFMLETTSNCMLNNGQQIQMRSTHPSRKVRVWLDRFHRGIGTSDRSRTDLPPGVDPEPLGCSRSAAGVQEWRIVRAVFVD
jgi:hypothetical protein